MFSLYSFKSYSGLLPEPYAGFDFSNESISWPNLEFGGRVGYIWKVLMVGADFYYKDIKADYGTSEQDTTVNNSGLFVGWIWTGCGLPIILSYLH